MDTDKFSIELEKVVGEYFEYYRNTTYGILPDNAIYHSIGFSLGFKNSIGMNYISYGVLHTLYVDIPDIQRFFRNRNIDRLLNED